LRISIIEDRKERRLVLEGKLIWPWTTEVKSAYKKARENLGGRELVVDLKNLTIIAQEGENLLEALMNEGVKLRGSGVFAKQALRQVSRRARSRLQEPIS